MNDTPRVDHRRQFCSRCNHMMFEFYASPDGHFGLANLTGSKVLDMPSSKRELECSKCGARYRLLDRMDGSEQAVKRV